MKVTNIKNNSQVIAQLWEYIKWPYESHFSVFLKGFKGRYRAS